MGKSKELIDYEKKEWNEVLEKQEFFDETMKKVFGNQNILEMDSDVFKSKVKQVNMLVNEEYPDRPYFVKYHNFIMDVRKPSFFVFIFMFIMSIKGTYSFIKWIINLIF